MRSFSRRGKLLVAVRIRNPGFTFRSSIAVPTEPTQLSENNVLVVIQKKGQVLTLLITFLVVA